MTPTGISKRGDQLLRKLLVLPPSFHVVLIGSIIMSACTGMGPGIPSASPPTAAQPARGPLRVCVRNPRYFADDSGRPVLLVGSHMWNSLQDMGPDDPPAPLDWEAYLGFLEARNHNFMRLWHWDLTHWDTGANNEPEPLRHFTEPHPWPRTGPGEALDGKPKFDLGKFDDAYFKRLRQRVKHARDRGIYISIMLFEGWGLQFVSDGWAGHPFNPANNTNGIDGQGLAVYELGDPDVLATQEAYVRKVIDTVSSLDNVLYEISNENHPASTQWQYHMIRFIKEYEANKPKQHPVGMTFQFKGGSNETLFDSPADWISPNPEGGYSTEPPPGDGQKVIITDTDHLWGLGGSRMWVWKSFCQGLNPIFMDTYDGVVLGHPFDPQYDPIRDSLGHCLALSRRIDLARCVPAGRLSSTGYCLADAGKEYVVYLPDGGSVTVDLTDAEGELALEWINAGSGEVIPAEAIAGGSRVELTAPFGGDAVVVIQGR